MHDLSKPQNVIVKGRQVTRPATVNSSDYNEFCLASTRELNAYAHMNKIKPCNVSTGIDLTDKDKFKKYKEDIKKGIRREECKICWDQEDKGMISERLEGNKRWLDPWHGNSHNEIILSNDCNASCIFCNSTWSSKWKNDIIESKTDLPNIILENKHLYYFDAHIPNDQEINAAYNIAADLGKDFTKMACIGVYGGEPGLKIIEEDHVGKILNIFYDNNEMWDRNIRYDFNTSLNFSQSRCKEIINYFIEQKELFPNYDPIIQPSIESLGSLFNYVRYGNNFENFNKNLDMFLQQEIFQIEFTVSLNSFVLKDLKKLIEYINNKAKMFKQPVRLKCRMVDWLPFFKLSSLDNSFLYHVNDARSYVNNNRLFIENNKKDVNLIFENIEKQLNCTSDNYANDAIDFINWIESERNLRLQDVNPEVYSYFLKMSSN